MQASLVIAHNIFKRDAYQVSSINRKKRLARLAPKTDKPFICMYNGQAILRADWHKTVVKNGDVVAFIICPPQGGGGGSNPLQAILMIGLMIAAPGLGAALASSLGITGTILGVSAGTLLGGLISIAGRALIGSIFGGPSLPKSQVNSTLSAPSPTYTLSAQGNVSRIGDAIPVIYGTMKIYPNYGAQPYTEYAGNEQYLYQLFCVGQGYYDIDGIYIYDTPIATFPEITYEIVQPGGTVTLFPTDVVSSGAVSGQELVDVAIGPFVANNAGTLTNALAIDMVLSRGLYYANDNGGLDARTVTFKIEAQAINDLGIATGPWFTLQDINITAATSTPQRYSYRYDVAQARYQVRVTRTSPKDTSSRVGNDLNWVGLRAYIPGTQQYGNVTMVAMRMRASNSLTEQSSRKVNMVVTRKLPIWNGAAWSAPTRTRSIAWAFADICRAKYGANYADNRIDLSKLVSLDATWSARGDTFNGAYDSASTFWEALTLCAKAGRAKPYIQNGIIHIVRDEPRTLPVAMFNMQNIVAGSMSVQYLMPTDETADAIEVQYWNEEIWGWDFIDCAFPDSISAKPAKVQIFGVTNRAQAYREGMYLCAVNKYRRTLVSLGSEMEGFIPSFGDLCAISHDRPSWGQSGEIVAYDTATRIVTTSEPLDFSVPGTYYFAFRFRDGSVSAPYQATAGANEYQAILTTPLSFSPDIGVDRERTYYTFGIGQNQYKKALLAGVKPKDLQHCDLSFVLDDERVYTADIGYTAANNNKFNLVTINKPVVTGLTVSLVGTAISPKVSLVWQPAASADYYHVDISYDNVIWQRVVEPITNSARFDYETTSAISIRVRAVGLFVGDWTILSNQNLLMQPPASVTNFNADGSKLSWTSVAEPDIAGYRIRYQYGVNTQWESATPLHDGLVTDNPYAMRTVPVGVVTMLIKAVDFLGNESINATSLQLNFGVPVVENLFESYSYSAANWPGSLTGATIVGGNIVGGQSDPFYKVDNLPFYGADTDPFYNANYDALEWVSSSWWSLASSVGKTAIIAYNITGTSTAIYYRKSADTTFYGNDADPFYGNDADPFYKTNFGDWLVYPGAITVGAFEYQFKVTSQVGTVRAQVSNFTVQVTAPTISLNLNNVAISAAGTRLTGAIGVFNTITNVQATLVGVNSALKVEVQDKSSTLGPLVVAKDLNNNQVAAVSDFNVKGY